ncbi:MULTISPECIES: hypothetical protein [unclassified Spiroplasma]|uniref:hypothetical protein n=1 Tax=unclassified Spiroplasma TaxID=2637901 RepID=UPI00313C50C8
MNEKEKAAKLLHDAGQESRRLDLLLVKAKKQEETLKKIEEEKQINKHKSRNPKI